MCLIGKFINVYGCDNKIKGSCEQLMDAEDMLYKFGCYKWTLAIQYYSAA